MGPKGLKDLMKASTFADDYFQNVQLIEFPDNLEEPMVEDIVNVEEGEEGSMIVDEESKEAVAKEKPKPSNFVQLTFDAEL